MKDKGKAYLIQFKPTVQLAGGQEDRLLCILKADN